MFLFVARRLAWAGVLAFVISLVTFILFFLIPNDAATLRVGRGSLARSLQTQFDLQGRRPQQYAQFLEHIFTADFGRSTRTREDASRLVGKALPVTASLVIGGDGHVADDRLPDRDPLGAAAALAARQRDDGLRADRGLGAPGLGVADALVLPRREAPPLPGRRLLQLLRQRAGALRRRGRLGLAHGAAVVRVRAPVRGALRADAARLGHRDSGRGLRGRSPMPRAPEPRGSCAATCSRTRCSRSSRCSGWTSGSRSPARSSSSRPSGCRASGSSSTSRRCRAICR